MHAYITVRTEYYIQKDAISQEVLMGRKNSMENDARGVVTRGHSQKKEAHLYT
ncbi:MAG: hypothetical protein QXL15_02770 [Candidatus Korarchaeota archaeon]